MTPFCPQCLAVVGDHELRCGLDQQFLKRRTCPHCQAELYPRELFCAACGAHCEEPRESLLVPPMASSRRILGSLLLDYLSVSLFVFLVAWSFLGWIIILASPLVAFFYRALARSGGKQSFGQSIFHVLTLSETAGPAGLEGAVRRCLYEILYIPRILVSQDSALQLLEVKSLTLEVALA